MRFQYQTTKLIGYNVEISAGQVSGSDLCSEPSCQCTPNEALPDLRDVTCSCTEKQVSHFLIGIQGFNK